MAGDRPNAPHGTNALLVRIIGVVLAMVIGISAMGIIPTTYEPSAGKKVGQLPETNIEEARQRALKWSTPECKERMRKAVTRAKTERDVEEAAWAACPDHPDAYD